MTSPLWLAVCPQSLQGGLFTNESFDNTAFAVSGKVVCPVNKFNHTSGLTVVAPTGCPKSVLNRCDIKFLVTFLSCQLVDEFSVGISVFVTGLSQISFFFFFAVFKTSNF